MQPVHAGEAGPAQAPVAYVLQLADSALVLGQRNAEWCGHGPVLEEDIAQANIGLDLMGQARALYQHAAALMNAGAMPAQPGLQTQAVATEDTLAYFRGGADFRNYTLLELPHHGPLAGTAATTRDYATTIVRNFLYSQFMLLVWDALQASGDAQLAAIAARSVKEVRYHVRHARDWLLRLGDGTAASHDRAQSALAHLLPYTREFFTVSPAEAAAAANGTGVDARTLQAPWNRAVDDALAEATLQRPTDAGHLTRGKEGLHSEHLGFLLAEMQSLARQHPHAVW